MEAITRFSAGDAIPEKSTAIYTAVLKDQTGTAIDPSAVTALTVTLTDAAGTVQAGWPNAENALNTGNGTLVTGGIFTFQLDPADTNILGTAPQEQRFLVPHVTFSGGKEHYHNASFWVRNLVGVS